MTHDITVVGIDLGKNWFHIVGIDCNGKPLLRRKLNRAQLAEFAANTPQCVIAIVLRWVPALGSTLRCARTRDPTHPGTVRQAVRQVEQE